MTSSLPITLSISFADPSGCSGIQADVQTFASLGCHPLSVITGISVADTRGQVEFHPVETEWVIEQARYLLEDMSVSAFKIGHVGSIETAMALAEIAADYPDTPLVLDPALGHGGDLATEELAEVIRDVLLPHTHLLVCNPLEARWLSSSDPEIDEDPEPDACARRLAETGLGGVLITSIANPQQPQEILHHLYQGARCVSRNPWQRLPFDYRGAGDTLSAAIAAFTAAGQPMAQAAIEAQRFVWQTLAAGYRPGMGYHVPDRLFWAWPDATDELTTDNESLS